MQRGHLFADWALVNIAPSPLCFPEHRHQFGIAGPKAIYLGYELG
jgi:hypothetical protein